MTRGFDVSLDELDADTRSDTLDIIEEIAKWRPSSQQWSRIEPILDRLEKALLESDQEKIQAAVVELELASPFRVPPVRRPEPDKNAERELAERQDRLDRMVHKISDGGRDDDQRRDQGRR